MQYIVNQLINGVCQGAIYALMAIGYSVVAGITLSLIHISEPTRPST